MEVIQLGLFTALSAAVLVYPGRDFLQVLSCGAALGDRAGIAAAGIAAAGGVAAATFVHAALAIIAFGVLLEWADDRVRFPQYLAGGYLILRSVLLRPSLTPSLDLVEVPPRDSAAVFVGAFMPAVRSGQGFLFVLAWFAVFTSHYWPDRLVALCLFAAVYVLLTFVILGGFGDRAPLVAPWLRARPGWLLVMSAIALGAMILVSFAGGWRE